MDADITIDLVHALLTAIGFILILFVTPLVLLVIDRSIALLIGPTTEVLTTFAALA